jgi:hypothetical protein
LLYDLAFYYAINSNSVWDAIEQLQKKCVINDEAAKNLSYAASFATLLRLRVYQHYNQQKDDISVSACDSIIDQTIFYLPKHYSQEGGKLFNYYNVVLPLHSVLDQFFKAKLRKHTFLAKESFFDDSPKYKIFYFNKITTV